MVARAMETPVKEVRETESAVPPPTGTQAPSSNSNGDAKAQKISDKGEAEKTRAAEAVASDRAKSEERSFIDRIVSALGFSDRAAEDNARKDLREKTEVGGGKMPTSEQIAATAKNVGGESGDMSKIDLAALTAATKGLRDNGATMVATDTLAYAGAAQPKQKAEGAMV